jgi:nucleotide-binding universal stress UspA family protein
VLVPVANNAESERAMDAACRLVAVHVVEVPAVLPLDSHMTDEEAAAHRLLERAAAVGDVYGVTAVPRIIRARDAGEAIVALADQLHSEVVVIGAPRKRRAPFGSTVEHVLKKASCRVLFIAEAAAAA